MKTTNHATAKEIFEKYSGEDTLFFTSDGLPFFDENPAQNHAKELEDKTIDKVSKSDLSQAVAGEKEEEAPKTQTQTQTPAQAAKSGKTAVKADTSPAPVEPAPAPAPEPGAEPAPDAPTPDAAETPAPEGEA